MENDNKKLSNDLEISKSLIKVKEDTQKKLEGNIKTLEGEKAKLEENLKAKESNSS